MKFKHAGLFAVVFLDLDKDTLSGLRRLRQNDSIEINGAKFTVVSVWESNDSSDPKGEKETRSEGIEFELRGEDDSSHSLMLSDIEVEYERIDVLEGPAPLNPNPDVLFVQDSELNKTYKYSVKKRLKEHVTLKFMKGNDECKVVSVKNI